MVATLQEAVEMISTQHTQLQRQGDQIATLQEQITTLETALKSAQTTITRQQHQLNQFLERLYGRKSERYDPNQLCMQSILRQALPDPDAAGEETPAEEPEEGPPAPPARNRQKKRKRNGRLPIPEHLPREMIELEVPESERICPYTGAVMEPIGHDDTEQLEYTPGRLTVKVYRRYKYAAPDRRNGHAAGVAMAPLPDHPIPKCKAAPGLLSHAIISKYSDHLPWYRQDGIFQREGVHVPRSTLDDWGLRTAEAIAPLGQALKQAVLDTDVLFTDDSVIPLLEAGRGRTRQARMWVYIRGGPGPPLAAYDFTVDRRKQRPLDYLGGYQGYIHADAYSGYDELFRRDGIIEVGCWCHARRAFDEAMASRPREASEIIALIGRMYRWERELRPLPPEQRHAQRQQTVRPIVDAVLQRVEQLRPQATPAEPLHKACDYVLNQREALQCFLQDGRLEADNNTAENAIRPLAIGRKNWLFSGSERGGRATALYLGLIQSCKACRVNPWNYFDDVLRGVMSHPVRRLRELLPDQWEPLARDSRGMVTAS